MKVVVSESQEPLVRWTFTRWFWRSYRGFCDKASGSREDFKILGCYGSTQIVRAQFRR